MKESDARGGESYSQKCCVESEDNLGPLPFSGRIGAPRRVDKR
jgi:hypothetical protein